MTETNTITIDKWVIRVREPEGEGPHPALLLLHGLTGDENVMWVFSSRLPKDHLILAPRGLYPAREGGYSWHKDEKDGWPGVQDFYASVDALLDMLDALPEQAAKAGEQSRNGRPGWAAVSKADFSRVSLVGFSQGAALAYTLAMLHPRRIRLLAGLAGFVPEGMEALVESRPLQGKQVFVTHGTEDDKVPVERARRSVELLEQAGADVNYCEEEVGHKLSLTCFRSMGVFFKANKTALT